MKKFKLFCLEKNKVIHDSHCIDSIFEKYLSIMTKKNKSKVWLFEIKNEFQYKREKFFTEGEGSLFFRLYEYHHEIVEVIEMSF